MTTKKDGGPAFHSITAEQRGDPAYNGPALIYWRGMSKLDYFAAAALPVVAVALRDTPKREGITLGQHVAEIAYAIAERMLAESAK